MSEVMLPYRTEWDVIEALLDYAKGKGVDRATLEARLGAGESLRETLNAVEQLGLARRDDSGDIRLTEAGERLAYAASEVERRRELARAMLGYEPYAIPLERAVANGMSIIDGPWIERVWQVDMRLGQPRNRVEEARTFFFRLADDAGLGTYRRGVRGQPSRLELSPQLGDLIAELREPPAQPEPRDRSARPEPAAVSALPPLRAGESPVAVSISVDMSDWDLEKIAAFLRLMGIVGER